MKKKFDLKFEKPVIFGGLGFGVLAENDQPRSRYKTSNWNFTLAVICFAFTVNVIYTYRERRSKFKAGEKVFVSNDGISWVIRSFQRRNWSKQRSFEVVHGKSRSIELYAMCKNVNDYKKMN